MGSRLSISTFYQPASLYAAHVSLSDGGKLSLMVSNPKHRFSLSEVFTENPQVLANLLLLYAALLVLGFQYLFYDLPTTSHVDEVFEKFILAIIETLMAMFMTGQGVNGRFLLMFTLFLVGKWWALFGEERVKRQEEYPLLLSMLLYARLSVGIVLSISFDICMVIYTAYAVQPNLQPGMIVLFLFEFATLTMSSLSTATRLVLSIIETVNIRRHTQLNQQQQRPGLMALTEATRAGSPRGRSWTQDELSTDLPVAAGDREMEETVQLWHKCRRWRTYHKVATGKLAEALALKVPPSANYSCEPRLDKDTYLPILFRHLPYLQWDPRIIYPRDILDRSRSHKGSAGSRTAGEYYAIYRVLDRSCY